MPLPAVGCKAGGSRSCPVQGAGSYRTRCLSACPSQSPGDSSLRCLSLGESALQPEETGHLETKVQNPRHCSGRLKLFKTGILPCSISFFIPSRVQAWIWSGSSLFSWLICMLVMHRHTQTWALQCAGQFSLHASWHTAINNHNNYKKCNLQVGG